MNRAYVLLTVKAVEDDSDEYIIRGVATTPEPDRVGDIVEPLGVQFKNPMPLLYQHDSERPIGTVTFDKPTKSGITFEARLPKNVDNLDLKARIELAWAEVKAGLIRAVSIGFRALEYAFIEGTGGIRFIASEVMELSLVTIPANAGATITSIKSIDTRIRAATGIKDGEGRPVQAGVTATSQPVKLAKGPITMKKTIAEQISAFEATRAAKSARMNEIMEAAADKGETLDTAQTEEYDGLDGEVKSINGHLVRLRALEQSKATTAQPVNAVVTAADGEAARGGAVVVKTAHKLAPGIAFARLAKVKTISRLDGTPPLQVAEQMYGAESDTYGLIKTAVVGGTTISGNWAANLVGTETGAFADFAAYLRPGTIIGKFGAGDVPSLRAIPFRVPLISQTGGGAGYWVGQGKAKPLTSFDFARTTLEPLKVANIAVLTEESIRDSSPSSEAVVRDALRDALIARLDTDFIDPAKAASAGVSPASVTNGAAAIASTGTNADAVRLDVRAVFAKFIAANNAPTTGVWIMSATTALALSLMVNALGQREFPGIGMNGGIFEGMPAIISEYAGSLVALVNASDIYLGDEGGVSVDMSREASLEMSDAPANTPNTGTGASLVSMFQTNSVALRAERTINWKRRRTSAVAYLTGVAWGGAVPAS